MKTNTSRIRRLLAEGKFPTVFKINLSDPRAIEIAGLSGVDSVWRPYRESLRLMGLARTLSWLINARSARTR